MPPKRLAAELPPRRKPDAAGRLRREPPGDRIGRVGLIVASMLVMLGLAGVGVIVAALLSPKQSDYTYTHVGAAGIAVAIGMGALAVLILHVRAGSASATDAGDPPTPDDESPHTPHRIDASQRERLRALRLGPVRRVDRIDGAKQLSRAEYFCLLLLTILGIGAACYFVWIFALPTERVNERSVLGAPLAMLLGALAYQRIHRFHRAATKKTSDETAATPESIDTPDVSAEDGGVDTAAEEAAPEPTSQTGDAPCQPPSPT